MVTVGKVLKLEILSRAKVIAGREGLNNEIKSVTVAEVPDAADWLRGGELVLTTGYFIQDDVQLQDIWVEKLIKHNAAALAIKTSRFLGELPKNLIEIANKENFPIIELPNDVVWPRIIEEVLNEIITSKIRIIERKERIHENFLRLILAGGNFEQISFTLSMLVGMHVIIYNVLFNPVASYKNAEVPDGEMLIKFGYSPNFVSKIRSSLFYKEQVNEPKIEVFHDLIKYDSTEIFYLIYPIIASGKLFGFIGCFHNEKDFINWDDDALDMAATASALLFIMQNSHLEAERRLNAKYLLDMLNSQDDEQLQKIFNIDLTRPYIIICMDLIYNKKYEMSNFLYSIFLRIYESILNSFLKIDKKCAINLVGDTIILLFSPDKTDKKDYINSIKEGLKDFQKNASSYGPYLSDYKIGVSECHIGEIKKSYFEAKHALEFCYKANIKLMFYSDMGVVGLIEELNDINLVRDFVEGKIGQLAKYDKSHNTDYLATLKHYIESDCDVKETATHLHIHPNTLSYRIKKIEYLFDINLNNAFEKANILLAYKLNDYYKLLK